MPDEPKLTSTTPIQQIALTPSIGTIYTNGMSLVMSQSDIQLTLNLNGKPSFMVAMGLPTAKTLQKHLENAINDYERKTGVKVHDLTEIAELLKNP